MQFNINDISFILPYVPHIIIVSVIILIISFTILALKYIFGTGDLITQLKKQNQILGGILIELKNKNSITERQDSSLEQILTELNKKSRLEPDE